MAEVPLIELADLSIGFASSRGEALPVLRNFDLAISRGETVGLVGESGSGKSTVALAAMGYLKRGLRVLGGTARFRGQELFKLAPRELAAIRGGRLALVPQNAGQSLTPNLKIGAQIVEALRLHSSRPANEHSAWTNELLRRVRLPDPEAIAGRYPHELSGGQQQRAAIAMALAGEPEALLLDEPTTGLDVTTQAHILALLTDLAAETGTAMLYISHDLGAIARTCSRIVVMYAGEAVLEGTTSDVLRRPAHPYARGLLASIPRLTSGRLPVALDGRPPAPGQVQAGCAFADRCTLAEQRCRQERPKLAPTGSGGLTRCLMSGRVPALQFGESAGGNVARADKPASPILAIERLSISYARPTLLDQLLGRTPSDPSTVEDIAISLAKGETVALVGESGSGKSTILKAIAGLVAPARGRISFDGGADLPPRVEKRRPDELRRIQLVFQNPDESLNPRHTVAQTLEQPLKLYFGLAGDDLRRKSIALLDQVRLGAHYLDRLPAQLSGGEKQRVAIARAFAGDPVLVLCDEVTSALDVSVQAAVLALLDRLKRERQATYLFVSHDLAVVRAIADRVAVLYQGRLCEIGPAAAVYSAPNHPYTEALMAAVLEPDPEARPVLLAEDVTELSPPVRGCPFQRCCHRRLGDICTTAAPPERQAGGGHVIRCHRPVDELAALQRGTAGQGAAG